MAASTRQSAVPEDTETVPEITRYLNARQDTDIGPIAEDNVLKEPMFPSIPLLKMAHTYGMN